MSRSHEEGALGCDNGLRKRKVNSPTVDMDAVSAALEGMEGEEANMETDGKSPKAFGRSPDGTSTFIQLVHMLNYVKHVFPSPRTSALFGFWISMVVVERSQC